MNLMMQKNNAHNPKSTNNIRVIDKKPIFFMKLKISIKIYMLKLNFFP